MKSFNKLIAVVTVILVISSLLSSYAFAASAVPKLKTLGKTDESITLRWDASYGATGYNIYRKLSSESKYSCINSTKTATSYTDSNLKPYTKYNYYVVAKYSKGTLNTTNTLTETTKAYTYTVGTYDGVSLSIVKTYGKNIQPNTLNNRSNLKNSKCFGINAGYFSAEKEPNFNFYKIHCMGIKNNKPIFGTSNNSDNGWYNIGKRGTIVYDGENDSFSCQVIGNGWEVRVKDKGNFWAIGGVSMNLGSSSWKNQAITTEKLNVPIYVRNRTGMVFKGKDLYLIVTPTECTAAQFRSAIQKYFHISDGSTVSETKGIFLDGANCSQMRCYDNSGHEVNITYERPLVPIVQLINNN